jgi:hypothetical protein
VLGCRARRVIGWRAHRSGSTCEGRTETERMVVSCERAVQSARFCGKGWALAFSFIAGGWRGAFSFDLQVHVRLGERVIDVWLGGRVIDVWLGGRVMTCGMCCFSQTSCAVCCLICRVAHSIAFCSDTSGHRVSRGLPLSFVESFPFPRFLSLHPSLLTPPSPLPSSAPFSGRLLVMHDAGELQYSVAAYSRFRAGSVAERPLWEEVDVCVFACVLSPAYLECVPAEHLLASSHRNRVPSTPH